MPLLTKPLSPQERRAVALRRQGMTTDQIADEMAITLNHVWTLLCTAKRKGAVLPVIRRPTRTAAVPIERLVHIRTELRRAGYGHYGMARIIAERVGLTVNCVKVRLWKHDHAHKPQGEQAA